MGDNQVLYMFMNIMILWFYFYEIPFLLLMAGLIFMAEQFVDELPN